MTTWRSIRTYVFVTLITLLIWVWAEQETVRGTGRRVDLVVKDMPVVLALPAGRAERASVEDTVLHNVRIRVAPEFRDQIERGELVPVAIVTLSVTDLGSNLVSRTAELGPMGITGRMADPAPTVRVRIERPTR